MRLGVLDIGSNTGHLLVVDAYRGAAPLPASSFKEPLRLAEHVDDQNRVTDEGVDLLVEFVAHALEIADDKGCEQIYSFATSAVRDADNADEVLRKVRKKTDVDIRVLPGEDEARLTFLAVRRWFGWSSGRLAVFDIGGGSLEIAGGDDESPDVAWSLPLGAARLTRERLSEGRLAEGDLRRLRKDIRAEIAHDAGTLLRGGAPDHAVATSKTFRSLARICGAAPSAEGLFVRRILAAADLEEWIPKLLEMEIDQVAGLPGVSKNRAHQLVAGALVASAVLDIFDLPELEICPWALREGVILDRLDQLSASG
jgi:exopolyphosphatase/guanosine-5'-triphosphate,3'-diphosphate pyrophosphatase